MNDDNERRHDSQEHVDDHDRDEAVIGADDTGMIADRRLTVETEIADELETDEDPEGVPEL